MTYDVLVYGPVFCDLIFTDLPRMPNLGEELYAGDFTATVGGSAIVAVGLHRLDARVGLIADLGNDPLSQIMRQILDDAGLDLMLVRQHDYPLPQVTAALSFPNDRAFVTCFRRPPVARDISDVLRHHSAQHLHVCSFLAAQEIPNACHVAHATGMTISLDPGWDETALRDPQLAAMIADSDLFMPNQKELCHIAGVDDTRADAAVAQTLPKMNRGRIILKQGAAGATAYSTNGAPIHLPALPIMPIDTTGAGDAFDAGFLCEYVRGAALADCMRMGVVCGGLSTTTRGGIGALPTRMEANEWLAKLRS